MSELFERVPAWGRRTVSTLGRIAAGCLLIGPGLLLQPFFKQALVIEAGFFIGLIGCVFLVLAFVLLVSLTFNSDDEA